MELQNPQTGTTRLTVCSPDDNLRSDVMAVLTHFFGERRIHGLNLLLVSDDSALSASLTGILKRAGARLSCARSAAAARLLTGERRFDLLFVDAQLADSTGDQFVTRYRATETDTRRVRIVQLATTVTARCPAAAAAGADFVLSLPRDAADGLPAGADWDVDVSRFASLLRAVGPDAEGELLQCLRQDLEDVDCALRAGLVNRDWAAIRAQTHVLVSLAGTVGADHLHGVACDVNDAARRFDRADTDRLSGPILSGLTRLIEFVNSRAMAG